jgi:hypothetical protein
MWSLTWGCGHGGHLFGSDLSDPDRREFYPPEPGRRTGTGAERRTLSAPSDPLRGYDYVCSIDAKRGRPARTRPTLPQPAPERHRP